MPSPFTGRRAELAAVNAILDAAWRSHRPAAALVVGRPGSGKTRLLAEITGGRDAVRLTGFEPMQSMPLAAAGPLLRTLANEPLHGPAVHRLAFEEGGTEPSRLFEAAHRALGRSGRVLSVIDDVQWLDAQSLALLQYLVQGAASARQPFALLAASRPAPAAESLRTALSAALATSDLALLELRPLSRAEGVELVRTLDRSLREEQAADLWRRAGGWPFWLEALARVRGPDGADAIDGRLRSLSRDAGEVLAVLAVAARGLVRTELERLLSWPEPRVEEALRELSNRALVVQGGGVAQVAHDLIRERAAAEIPEHNRRRLDAALADLIESSAADDAASLAEALRHRLAAGQPGELLARRLLEARGAGLLGSDTLARIASISDSLPSGAGRDELDGLVALAAAREGDQELALERFGRTGRHLEAAQAAYVLRRASDARRHLELARNLAPPHGEGWVRLAALDADVRLWLEHDVAGGRAMAEAALAAAHELADRAGGFDRLDARGAAAYLSAVETALDGALQEDAAEAALDLARLLVEIGESLEDGLRLQALLRAAFAFRPLGRHAESETHYRAALELARKLLLPGAMVDAGQGLARELRIAGRLDEAWQVAAETAEVAARQRNAPRRWGSVGVLLHSIELRRGDPATALRAIHDAISAEADPHFRLAIHELVAEWLARTAGDREAPQVRQSLSDAQADSAAAGCARCAGELLIVGAEAYARIGELDRARADLAEWEARGPADHEQNRAWRLRAQASIAEALGDSAAMQLLRDLQDALRQIGLRDDLFWATLDLGRVQARLGLRAEAVDTLKQAAKLAEDMRAVTHGRLVAAELRRLGVRAWRRGRTDGDRGLDRLSGREAEIARLISDGRSNKEISAALVVSPKTVERHVTNVLAKLGLRNRTELAMLVRDIPDDRGSGPPLA